MTTEIWFILIILFVIAEAATSVALVTVWFIPPAIISAIMAFNGASVESQIGVFLILSIILFMLTRPIVRKLGKKSDGKTNIFTFYGKEILIDTFDESLKTGTTIINGVVWNVRSEDSTFKKGDKAIIDSIAGNTLVIVNIKEGVTTENESVEEKL